MCALKPPPTCSYTTAVTTKLCMLSPHLQCSARLLSAAVEGSQHASDLVGEPKEDKCSTNTVFAILHQTHMFAACTAWQYRNPEAYSMYR
jgi:hypothetical protein